jgi:hypothetical protein
LVLFGVIGTAWADDEDPEPASGEDHKADEPDTQADEPKEEHHEEAKPADDEHHEEAKPADEHHDDAAKDDANDDDAKSDEHHEAATAGGADDLAADEAAAEADVDLNAKDSDGDGTPDSLDDGDIDNDGVPDAEEEDPPTDPFDEDGDGVLEPDEIADRKEFAEYFDDIPNQPDDAALEGRPEDAELKPSISVEQFRQGVRIVKKIVLGKMAKKAAKKADKRMAKFTYMVFGLSCCGLLLLLMPLFLKKKYPNAGSSLWKYSAMAAGTFFITVNLFGGVLFGMRQAQNALSGLTNPSVAIAGGVFDTLDRNADEFIYTGKELFLPTLEQMRNNPEEQPAVQLLENGMKIVQDAKVFLSMAKLFKKVDFLFGILPIILTVLTLVLFIVAIKPTLMAIIKLPAAAAEGRSNAGREVVGLAVKRVKGEMLATICTVGVLTVLSLFSAFVLGRVVEPALATLLRYFSDAVMYLQFVEGASSGLVFVSLFGVILFLVLNLAVLILSMSFFLGKSQKIFQARFNEGDPLSKHQRFFKWGIPSVLFVQVFPLLFVYLGNFILQKLNHSIRGDELDAEKVSWTKMLLAGPLVLIVAFAVLFWAARGFKAIKFLQSYKVKPKAPKGGAAAEPVPPT